MKIILSRKGFDSSYGEMASPILADGSMLSFPIPLKNHGIEYDNLLVSGVDTATTLDKLICQLNPKYKWSQGKTAHLDPYLSWNNPSMHPAFGQADAPLTHLESNGVVEGSIFLFFGWFRQAERTNNNEIKFVRNAPDIHVIYGYLEVDEILDTKNISRPVLQYHPHVKDPYMHDKLFIASKEFSHDKTCLGSGTFKYNQTLQLTKHNQPNRTLWELPECFKDVSITYHPSKDSNVFKTADIGQEFIVSEDKAVQKWAINLIRDSERSASWISPTLNS